MRAGLTVKPVAPIGGTDATPPGPMPRAQWLLDDVRYALAALRLSPAHVAAVVAAVAFSAGVALPILSLRHRHAGLLPGGSALQLLLRGRWPAGWGTTLETTAQHAGILAARDILFAFAGLVVAMACASIGALVLARAAAARRDVAVRAAVGAGPAAVLREVGLEAALVGLVGLVGLLAVAAAGAALTALSPELIRSWLVLHPGVGSILAAASPLLCLLLFAPLAALPASTWRLAPILGAARTTARPEEGSLRQTLAVAQLTAALSLLIAAGLLLGSDRSRVAAASTAATSDTALADRILLSTVTGPGTTESATGLVAWDAALLRRVQRLPGVSAATIATPGAWVGGGAEAEAVFTCPRCSNGQFATPVVPARLSYQAVGPGFFSTLGVPVRGRVLSSVDMSDTARVAVIDRSFEALFQGVSDPIGQRVRIGRTGEWYRIIGVAPDVRARGVGAGLGATATIYLPALHYPAATVDLLVRASQPPDSRLRTALAAVVAQDGGRPVATGTLRRALDRLAAPLAWFGRASLVLAAVVLLLAVHGVAVVAMDEVRRRRRELALRSALGATPLALAWLVLRRAAFRLLLAACFTTEGVAIVRWLLQRMSPVAPIWDPGVLGLSLGVVAAAALLASMNAVRAAFTFEPRAALADDR